MINKCRQEQIRTFNSDQLDPAILTGLLQQLNYSIEQYSKELSSENNVSQKQKKITKKQLPKIYSERTTSRQRIQSQIQDNTCYNPTWLIDKSKRRVIERHHKECNTFIPQFILDQDNNNQQQIEKSIQKPPLPIIGTLNKPKILLPPDIRKNPLNQRKRIYESLIYKEGLCNLINKGLIDKHIDVSPAFEQSFMLL